MANRVIRGPSITLDGSDYPLPDIVNEIEMQISEDQDEPDEANQSLVELWHGADAAEREIIDTTLANICGYGMKTLLTEAGADASLMQALKLTE